MRKNNRFLIAAAALLGLGGAAGIATPPPPSVAIALGQSFSPVTLRLLAPPPPQIKLSETKLREIIAAGEGYVFSRRWPFNGKNRAQRAALRGAFLAMW